MQNVYGVIDHDHHLIISFYILIVVHIQIQQLHSRADNHQNKIRGITEQCERS